MIEDYEFLRSSGSPDFLSRPADRMESLRTEENTAADCLAAGNAKHLIAPISELLRNAERRFVSGA